MSEISEKQILNSSKESDGAYVHKRVIIWRSVIAFVCEYILFIFLNYTVFAKYKFFTNSFLLDLHAAALYGIYLMTGPAQWKTISFGKYYLDYFKILHSPYIHSGRKFIVCNFACLYYILNAESSRDKNQ